MRRGRGATVRRGRGATVRRGTPLSQPTASPECSSELMRAYAMDNEVAPAEQRCAKALTRRRRVADAVYGAPRVRVAPIEIDAP